MPGARVPLPVRFRCTETGCGYSGWTPAHRVRWNRTVTAPAEMAAEAFPGARVGDLRRFPGFEFCRQIGVRGQNPARHNPIPAMVLNGKCGSVGKNRGL